MEQALGGVQDPALLDPQRLELRQHIVEIAACRLIRAAVLGRIDRVERYLELLDRGCKTLVVDVRQDDEFVMALEVLKRSDGIGERLPVPDRAAIDETVAPARRNAPFFREAPVDGRQQLTVGLCRRLDLLRGFMPRMRLENGVARELPRRLARERLEGLDDPRFPVDERAIAIEGQGFELGELRRRLALKADILDGLDGLVVEPDGIEPTTSSMPLSWTYVSHDLHCSLRLP